MKTINFSAVVISVRVVKERGGTVVTAKGVFSSELGAGGMG